MLTCTPSDFAAAVGSPGWSSQAASDRRYAVWRRRSWSARAATGPASAACEAPGAGDRAHRPVDRQSSPTGPLRSRPDREPGRPGEARRPARRCARTRRDRRAHRRPLRRRPSRTATEESDSSGLRGQGGEPRPGARCRGTSRLGSGRHHGVGQVTELGEQRLPPTSSPEPGLPHVEVALDADRGRRRSGGAEGDRAPGTRRQPGRGRGIDRSTAEQRAEPLGGEPTREVGEGAVPQQVQGHDRGGPPQLGHRVVRRRPVDDRPDRAEPLPARSDRDDVAWHLQAGTGRDEERLVRAGQPAEHAPGAHVGDHRRGDPTTEDGRDARGVGDVLPGRVGDAPATARPRWSPAPSTSGRGRVGEREEVRLAAGVDQRGRPERRHGRRSPGSHRPRGPARPSRASSSRATPERFAAARTPRARAAPRRRITPAAPASPAQLDQLDGVGRVGDPRPDDEVAAQVGRRVAGFGDDHVA